MKPKVVVTGGSGAAGFAVVQELLKNQYDVVIADILAPAQEVCEFRQVDLTEYGAVVEALADARSVIAFAADPEPDFDFAIGARRFRNNTLCTYNVFQAACALAMEKVVWASSETVMGFPFDGNRPLSFPVDETQPPQPRNSYALSKMLCEQMAEFLSDLHGIPIIGLRLSNVLFEEPAQRHRYEPVPDYWGDPEIRKSNLWGYIDARDAARAARLALESDCESAAVFNIAAADTIMNQSSVSLVESGFPGVEVKQDLGQFETLIDISKARRVLGWEPQYSWRDIISP